ncbi:MAG: hypothetical protein KDA58_01290 [Planctomycetaceae bacterium]|nr:hypothetical protein [Planctomycetaceae bacterium]
MQACLFILICFAVTRPCQAEPPAAIKALADRIASHVPPGEAVKIEPFRIVTTGLPEQNVFGNHLAEELFRQLATQHKVTRGQEYSITGTATRIKLGYQLAARVTSPEGRSFDVRPLSALADLPTVGFDPREQQAVIESISTVSVTTGLTADFTPPSGLAYPQQQEYIATGFSQQLAGLEATQTPEGHTCVLLDDGYLSPGGQSKFAIRILRRPPGGLFTPARVTAGSDGKPFVELSKGDVIRVEVRNDRGLLSAAPTQNTVGAMLYVDGVSWLQYADPQAAPFHGELNPTMKMNVHPGKTAVFQGWYLGNTEYREFEVRDRLDPADAATHQPSFAGMVGLLHVQICEQVPQGRGLHVRPGAEFSDQALKRTQLIYSDTPVAVISVRFQHPGAPMP